MTLGSTQVIVSEILYDSLGRQAITTVPVVKQDFPFSTIDASPFGFSSDLISSRDPQQESSTWVNGGTLTGSITSWVNPTSFCLEGDSNYAYQGVYYETDPTSRTLQSSKPGITFQKSADFSNPGYSESYYANYFPQALYSVLSSSDIQIPNVVGQDTTFTSPDSFPYMPMSAQQTSLGNNGLVTQASWADSAGRLQGKVTVDTNNTFILQSLSYQTGASLSQGVDSSTSQCPIMRQLQTYLPNYFDSSVKDPTSFYVLKQVNALGQVIQTYSPDQNNTLYYTDLYGRLRYSQTADQLLAGMIQYYLYDNLNRIIEVGLYPGTWNVDYSNVDSFQQNTLTLITPQPDQAQVQKSITYDGLPTLPFDPNAQGKIAQVVTYPSTENTPSPTCVVEVYTYDTWGRMISVAKAIVNTDEDSPFTEGSFTTQYTYSGFSKVLEIRSISNNTVFDVSYNYNLQGVVNQISYSPNGDDENIYPLASYTYNEQGQIAVEVLFDGNASTSIVTSSYAYGNSLNQLTNISTVLSPLNAPENITPLFGEKICYTNDPSGDNTKGTYQDGNIQLTAYAYGMNAESNYQLQYAYDAFGRLYCAGATPGWVGAWAGFGSTNQYGNFDSNGNYTFNGIPYNLGTNQISQASALSQRTPYTTAIFNYTKGGSGLTSSISYSSTNEENPPYTMTITSDLITQRPLEINLTNQEQTSDTFLSDAFLYDRKGERIQKVISSNNSSSITTYARGKGAQVLAEYDGNNNPQAYYIYGPLGLVSLYDPTSQQNSFILKDHLGSSRIVFNATTNEVTSYYGYDSFGNPFLNKSTQENAVVLRYLYTGQEWDQELGLYNYHARQYDPLYTKRFLSPDPAHQFPSPYTYCANNPINATDPTGKIIKINDLGNIAFSNKVKTSLANLTGSNLTWNTNGNIHTLTNIGPHNQGQGSPLARTVVQRVNTNRMPVRIIEASPKGSVGITPHERKILGSKRLARILGRRWDPDISMRFNFDTNPYYLPVTINNEEVLQVATAEIILGHELIHADHMGRGIYHDTTPGYYISDNGVRIQESLEEIYTVGLNPEIPNNDQLRVTENDIRGELGMALRNRYYERKDIQLRKFDIQGLEVQEVQPNQPLEMIMHE